MSRNVKLNNTSVKLYELLHHGYDQITAGDLSTIIK